MTNYKTLQTLNGHAFIKPEWVIGVGEREDFGGAYVRRVYLQGSQLCVLDTPENLAVLFEGNPPPPSELLR